MTPTIITPTSIIADAYKKKIKAVFKISNDEISKRLKYTLEQHAAEVEKNIKQDAINVHQMTPIILAALSNIRKNAAAIDLLSENETSLLHVRHIEELSTVIHYLISHPEKYTEYNWRWTHFPIAHGVRNKLINLGGAIDPIMQQWVDREINNLQNYVSKKITNDFEKSKAVWEKYSNWLYPTNLKDIFEEAGRGDSYKAAEYDWNSHAVHFSPLSDEFINYQLKHYTYSEFSAICTLRALDVFYRKCWVIVSRPDRIRQALTLSTFIEAYKLLLEKQDWFMEIIQRGGAHAKITEYALNQDYSLESAITLIVGQEQPDPLAIFVPPA